MSLNYTTYVNQVANMLVIPSTETNFTTMLPGMIDYAEGRIYRDLDLLYCWITDYGTVTASDRDFTLPSNFGTFLTVDGINILSSAGTTSSNGTRNTVTRVTKEFIDYSYPSGILATGIPQYYVPVTNYSSLSQYYQVTFGPAPDAAYTAEVTGVQRPTPLSASNSSTILTQYLPDVFMAASMVFGFGYMRDFGAQSDQPSAGQSWENQFQLLMKSAEVEQFRLKFQSEGWTSRDPTPIVTPPRV